MFLSGMRRRSLGIASTILLSALTLILPLLAGAQQPETNADCRSTVAAQQFIIPDGTEVELLAITTGVILSCGSVSGGGAAWRRRVWILPSGA